MTNQEIVQNLAKTFIERSIALKYKGKKRDEAALDYFAGAAMLANTQGDKDLHNRIGQAMVMLISVRGFIAVAQLADGN